MNASDEYESKSNPFSTRFTRPGQLQYRLPAGQSLKHLVDVLEDHGWRGQIIGPHGSGKSTLLARLRPEFETAGRTTWSVCLRDRQRSLPGSWVQDTSGARANLLIIDGYEQLSHWQRLLVRWQCRRRGWGLLVTAHADVGLPTILTTKVDLEAACDVVAQLTAGLPTRISDAVVAEHFHAAGGNLRETLFRLYDVWERGEDTPVVPRDCKE
jgi:hypothetical protein